jgi:hypothetical protein
MTPSTLSPLPTNLLAAADACDRAAEAQTPEAEMRSVMEVWRYKEEISLALLNAELNKVAATHRHQERLPLREDGEDTGRLTHRIPKKLFFHLAQQRNFGLDGFYDNGGLKDFEKAFPQTRVKTISGKTTVGYRSGGLKSALQSGARNSFRRRVYFARGTLSLAS